MGVEKTNTRKFLDKINWDEILRVYTFDELVEVFNMSKSIMQVAASEFYKRRNEKNELLRNINFTNDEDNLKRVPGAWMDWNNREYYRIIKNETV